MLALRGQASLGEHDTITEDVMRSRSLKLLARAIAGAPLSIGLSLTAPSAYAQSAPFAGMAGAWSGGGRVDLQDGTSERIRCRATYAVGGGGSTMQQQLRCASDSYRF